MTTASADRLPRSRAAAGIARAHVGQAGAGSIILIFVITALVFGRIVMHEFTWWDDPGTIHQNPRLNPPTLEGLAWYWAHAEKGLYIPLTYTAWGVIAAAAPRESPDSSGIGLHAWPFHAASVVVHAGCVLLVFFILRRIVRRDWPSLAGALLFALHPMQVETVAWASGLKDLLFAFFALLAILQYLKFLEEGMAPARRRSLYALALMAFIASMLCKPTGMVTPVLAGVLAYVALRRSARQIALTLGPWLILAALCALVTKLVQSAEDVPATSLWMRPLIMGDSLAFYLVKLVAPINLAVDYGRRPTVVTESPLIYIAWILPALLALLLWRVRKSHPFIAAGGLLFLAGLLPVLGLVTFSMQFYSTVTDHYLYLPMLGPALAGAALLSAYPRRLMNICAAGILAVLGVLSFAQARHWENELTLWQHELSINSESFLGHVSYGNELVRRGRGDEAEPHYRRALEINPDFTFAYDGYAALLIRQGRLEESVEILRKLIAVAATIPRDMRADLGRYHTMLGLVLLERERYEEAILEFERAVAFDPNRAEAVRGLRAARQARIDQQRE